MQQQNLNVIADKFQENAKVLRRFLSLDSDITAVFEDDLPTDLEEKLGKLMVLIEESLQNSLVFENPINAQNETPTCNLSHLLRGQIKKLLNYQIENHPDDRGAILDFVRSLGDIDPCSSVQLLGELSSDTEDIEPILGGIGFLGCNRSKEDGMALPPYTFQDAWTAASQIAWRSDDPDALNQLYNRVQQVASSLEGIVDSVSLKSQITEWKEIPSERLKPLYEILKQPLFDVCIHSEVKVQIQNFLNSKKDESYAATLQYYVADLLQSRLKELQPSPERNGLWEWLRGLRIYAQRVLG